MATPPDAQARTEKSATDFIRAVIARKTLFDFKGKAMMPMPPMAMFTLHGMNERFQSPVGHSGAENPVQPILNPEPLKSFLDNRAECTVATRFSLDGSIIPRRVKRLFDQRSEPRIECEADSGILSFRGTDHSVKMLNCSPSGAMVLFDRVPNIGETLTFRSKDRAPQKAQVRWVRDGKIGLTFLGAVR